MTTFANGESGLNVRNKINASITVTDAMATDGNGNVGIGVTPSAWWSGLRSLQVGPNSAPAAMWTGGYSVNIGSNIYEDTNYTFKQIGSSARAALYTQYDSAHRWYTTTNVGANTTIVPTQAMTLDASGNLLVGTTSVFASSKATISGDGGIGIISTSQTDGATFTAVSGFLDYKLFGQTNVHRFFSGPASSNVERMRIDASGNVGIGTTSPNAASILDAQSTTKGVRFPNMTTTQKNAIANVAGNVVFDTTLGKLCVNTGSGWQTIASV